MRETWDDYFASVARAVSGRSTCRRKKVGAVIVCRKRILATGYNGSGEGEAHCEDVGCNVVADHCTRTIHAEENALNQFNQYINPELNYGKIDIYSTLQPCDKCEKLLRSHFSRLTIHWTESQKEYQDAKLQN